MTALPTKPPLANIITGLLLFFALMAFSSEAYARSVDVIEGRIIDDATGEPIPFATVQLLGADRATLANGEGSFRLVLPSFPIDIKFSHIAYYSEIITVASNDTGVSLEVRLKSNVIDLGTMQVYSRRLDPGQRIIMEAIKRKKDILSKIHDYRYDAYIKFVVNDASKADSSRIWLITETQTTAFWQQPNDYKEIITSRKQSANTKAENNMVTVGEILNFNKNRIDLGRYSIVSPTAEDALDHYNYYLLDTLFIDSLPIFRLEIEPKNPDEPLFEGFLHIASSTYDVVMVDVGFSRGVEIPMAINPRYSQRFARFDNEYWMPIEIRFRAGIAFDFPLPGIPRKLDIEHVASLYSYQFDTGHPKGTFGEYLIEVEQHADEFDSARWAARQTVPLTPVEVEAYRRIDSLEHLPPSVGKIARYSFAVAAYLLLAGHDDLFRYDRAEGVYLGLPLEMRMLSNNLTLRLKTGYAFDAERSQHQIGATYRLHRARKLDLGFDYVTRITRRPTVVPDSGYSTALQALWSGSDPIDYYHEKGWRISASTKLVDQTRLRAVYSDFRQRSADLVTDYNFAGNDIDRRFWDTIGPGPVPSDLYDGPRDNPPIADGRLRSMTVEFEYDSRKMFRNKGRDVRLDEAQLLILHTGVEYASPGFIDNDFDFRRYYLDLRRRQRTLGLGITSIRLYAGRTEGDLPPQRYFAVDHADPILFGSPAFFTLNGTNFGGDRVLTISGDHNFRRRLFVASGIPLIKDIPFWLSIHGGAFWTEFHNRPPQPGNDRIWETNSPYREIGFGLGNLTPFLMPFNLAVKFTWQLSDYDTGDWAMFVGVDF
jgi:hypothetical protein